jgi:hypothetical protein
MVLSMCLHPANATKGAQRFDSRKFGFRVDSVLPALLVRTGPDIQTSRPAGIQAARERSDI